MSTVYFSSLKNQNGESPLNKITGLLNKCNTTQLFQSGNLIAVKVHFGELGNTAFLRPIYLRPVIELLKSIGVKPFLTDTNTLYAGMRTNSVDHLHNAYLNGFNYSTLQVPVIIADGLRGENTKSIEVNLELEKKVNIASEIVNSDGMVVVSHFKGHEVAGFGGAIKNLAMGCASRRGKLAMHSQNKPVVKQKNCTACGRCVENCQVKAIKIEEKAFITNLCVGCARCIAICPEKAISILWNQSYENTSKKMAEYAFGVIKTLQSKIVYINLLTSMSPACDCYGSNDAPITSDIGFLSSLDPVALDKASYDLVVKAVGHDPFVRIYPDLKPLTQLEHAQKIGIGSMDYKLIELE